MNTDIGMWAHDENELTLSSILRTAWNRKGLVAIVVLLFGLAAAAVALLITPIYRAEVTVSEVQEGGMGGGSGLSQLGGLASLAGVNLSLGGGSAQEAKAILRSRRLAEEFVTRKKLVPQLADESKRGALWFAVDNFRRRVLVIREDKRSGTTVVAIDWTDPQVAATWANEFVALANELIRTRARDSSSGNIAYLKQQIAQTNVVEMQQVMYNLIEREMKTLMLANGRVEYAFAVVDPAVASEIRFSPRRTLLVLFGVVLGLCVGVVAALLVKRAPAPHDAAG